MHEPTKLLALILKPKTLASSPSPQTAPWEVHCGGSDGTDSTDTTASFLFLGRLEILGVFGLGFGMALCVYVRIYVCIYIYIHMYTYAQI